MVKQFQVTFVKPGVFCKSDGRFLHGRFYWFTAIFEKTNRAVSKARRPGMGKITAHLSAGTIHPGQFIRKNSSWIMVGARGGW